MVTKEARNLVPTSICDKSQDEDQKHPGEKERFIEKDEKREEPLSFFFLAFHEIFVVHFHEKTNFLFPGDLSQMDVGTRLRASLVTIIHPPVSRPGSSLAALLALKSSQFPLMISFSHHFPCNFPY